MNQIKQVQVPDMGDFQDVEIIEVHIQAGDRIESENPLITLESDKATIDVPAPFSGKVENVLIKVGDKVSEGTPIVDFKLRMMRKLNKSPLRTRQETLKI